MKPNLFWKYFIVIAPLVLAGFLLYPTYRSGDLEKKELTFKDANGNIIDSVGYADFKTKYDDDIKSNKSKRIKLGLDLRGGMYVMLEVDIVKLLEEAASRDAIDDIFTQVIEKPRKRPISMKGKMCSMSLLRILIPLQSHKDAPSLIIMKLVEKFPKRKFLKSSKKTLKMPSIRQKKSSVSVSISTV